MRFASGKWLLKNKFPDCPAQVTDRMDILSRHLSQFLCNEGNRRRISRSLSFYAPNPLLQVVITSAQQRIQCWHRYAGMVGMSKELTPRSSTQVVFFNLLLWQLTRVLWDELTPQLEQLPKAPRQAPQPPLCEVMIVLPDSCSENMCMLSAECFRFACMSTFSGNLNAARAIHWIGRGIIRRRTCVELRCQTEVELSI